MARKINLRKVPQKINNKLATINEQEIIIGCLSSFSREDILNGLLGRVASLSVKNDDN